MKTNNSNCFCDKEEDLDVSCPFHGQQAMWNKTGYYTPPECETCRDSKYVYQDSKKFPVIKCPSCN